MKILSIKSVLKSAAFALTVFMVNQGTASAEHASLSSPLKNVDSASQRQTPVTPVLAGERQRMATGLVINHACDDDGNPCIQDDTNDDAL